MKLAVSSIFSRMIPSILAKTYDRLLGEVFVVLPEVKISRGNAKRKGSRNGLSLPSGWRLS
jgi:hypothetical protein